MSAVQPAATSGAGVASGSSFYAAMRILPVRQRNGMYAIYGFCRAVDDIADDGGPRAKRLAELDHWRRDIARLYARGDETQLTAGLRRPIETFGLEQADFLAVIDGMEMDVRSDLRAPDWATLDLYCDRVASAVGRLSAKIFGIDATRGRALAHHLGRALQLTNILRDLDEDATLGRLYLPRETLAEAGIDPVSIASVLADPRMGTACSALAQRARRHFEEADRIMAACDRNSVRSPRLMAVVYRAMLDKLEVRGWSPPRQRPRHSMPLILWAVLRHGLF